MADTHPVDDGGPAFPCQLLGQDGLPEFSGSTGMPLRAYFMASVASEVLRYVNRRDDVPRKHTPEAVATLSREIADAMLTEVEASVERAKGGADG